MRDVGVIVSAGQRQAGAGEAAVDEVWSVLGLLEAAFHCGGELVEVRGSEVADGPFHQGPDALLTHRRIANKALKATGHAWAFATLTRSPGCRAQYDHRRAVGDRYAAALRNLFGRLLTCLHHCLRTGEYYREEIAFPPREPSDVGE